ncbi:MAG: GAF domain-containing protein [Reyranella sp.]
MRAMMGILARARSEAELYREVCTAMVEVSGFRLAAVAARRDSSRHRVDWLAVHGTDEGYLEQVATAWEAEPGANEPLGRALVSGDVQAVADTGCDQAVGTWREQAALRGLRSAIALPLKQSGRTFAVLGVWADQAGAFDERWVDVLTTLARDLAIRAAALRAGSV